jgi:hypothetical protein
MKLKMKLTVIAVLVFLVITGVAAIQPGEPGIHYTNLKVLPKKVSSKVLSHIMIDEFEDGLGVGCNYCHAKENNSNKLDYASDTKPEKEIARSMMRMTIAINKKFFYLKNPVLGDSAMVVTCSTCHHGMPRPADAGL